MSTLLRYPGGKSRAVKTICPYFDSYDTIVSPFFGGGAIEISLATAGKRVIGYDSFQLLVEFWQVALEKPKDLADFLESKYFPMTKENFYLLQSSIEQLPDKFDRAAAFYVLNRTSFSGSTLSGGYSKGNLRFTKSTIQNLRAFTVPSLTVDYADFRVSISKHPTDMLYLDPPYMVKSKLYGKRGSHHTDFPHNDLFDLLKNRTKWILSYNDCVEIRDMYKNFITDDPKWAYGMSANKQSKELLIFSPDIKNSMEKNLPAWRLERRVVNLP